MERNSRETLSTEELEEVLGRTRPERLPEFFQTCGESLWRSPRPFADYMRETIRKKGLLQQEVFLEADIPESYGYRLISGERHTRKRDVILRICCGARFDLKETRRALRLAGMGDLYPRIPRDAALILAVREGLRVDQVNDLLTAGGFPSLQKSGAGD